MLGICGGSYLAVLEARPVSSVTLSWVVSSATYCIKAEVYVPEIDVAANGDAS